MRKWCWVVLLMSWLVAAPAAALEADDLVIGVGTSLQAVDPRTGALEILTEDLEPGVVTGIAVRPDGVVFFSQTSFLEARADVWRLDPRTGELSVFSSPGLGIGGLAMDRQDRLVVAVEDTSRERSAQPELIWLDSESGDEVLVIPLPVLGINDVDVDPEGRALLSTALSGALRVDPRTQALEWVGVRPRGPAVGTQTISAEADSSILVTRPCVLSSRLPLPPLPQPLPTLCSASLQRIDPVTAVPESVSFIEGQPMGTAVEATGGIVVSVVPGLNAFGPSRVVRVDPDDGSQTLVVGDLPDAGAIAVVPRPKPRIEVRPSRIRVGSGSRRTLSVVLLGSEHLDVRDVARDSLAFGPDGAPLVRSRVLRRGAHSFPDLLLFFRVAPAGLRPGDTSACLDGTAAGVDFRACDTVEVFGELPPAALAAGDLVVAAGASLFVVDPLSGAVELLSPDPSFGPLPAGHITGIALAPGGGELFFTLQPFAGFGSVWRVDPQTGARGLVAGGDFAGFLSPAGVVLEPGGDLLVVDNRALSRVDPSTGAVELVARIDGVRAGLAPTGLALEDARNALISTRNIFFGLSAVLRVDLDTSAVSVLADDLLELSGIDLEADGSVLVTSRGTLLAAPGPLPTQPGRSVIRIDPLSGATSLVSEEGLLMVPDGLAVEADGRIAVIDGGGPAAGDAVLRIDARDGDQSLLTEIPALSDASAIAVVPPEPRTRPGRGPRARPPGRRPPR